MTASVGLNAIVNALQPVIASVSGINAVYKRIPDSPPPAIDEPFAVIEMASGNIDFAQARVTFEYPINVYVMTRRQDNLGAEFDFVTPFVNSVPERLMTTFTLGGKTYGTDTDTPSYEFGDAQIMDQKYLSLVFHLRYKEKINATYSG